LPQHLIFLIYVAILYILIFGCMCKIVLNGQNLSRLNSKFNIEKFLSLMLLVFIMLVVVFWILYAIIWINLVWVRKYFKHIQVTVEVKCELLKKQNHRICNSWRELVGDLVGTTRKWKFWSYWTCCHLKRTVWKPILLQPLSLPNLIWSWILCYIIVYREFRVLLSNSVLSLWFYVFSFSLSE